MPTFVHAVALHGQVTLDYGYVLKLASNEELVEYWQKKRGSEFGKGLANFLGSKECESLTRGTYSGKEHVSDAIGGALVHICWIESKKDDKKEVLVKDVFDDFITKIFVGMQSSINKTGAIYIQSSGGYFPHSDNVVVHATIEQEDFTFPVWNKKIKVFQWQGGKHYYAKVDHLDVVDAAGNQKWNTFTEAERQAEIFAEGLKKG